jgi:hypothetical protein
LGSGKAAKFMGKTDREFTIVVDADKVPEVKNLEMVKRLEQGPYTIAMRADNEINLNDFPKGGSLTITPTADGSYVSSGFLNYIDEETLQESRFHGSSTKSRKLCSAEKQHASKHTYADAKC